MPLFSRRSPKPAKPAPPNGAPRSSNAVAGTTDRAAEPQFVAPPPLFRNEEPGVGDRAAWPGANPEGDGRPDDPDAPPRPGVAPPSSEEHPEHPDHPKHPDHPEQSDALASLLAPTFKAGPRHATPPGTRSPAGHTAGPTAGHAAGQTVGPSVAVTAGSAAGQTAGAVGPFAGLAPEAAAAPAATATATSTTASRDPLRTRILPTALLLFAILIGLLSVLLVFLFEPGAVGWAIVGAIVLIAIVQVCLLVGGIVVVRRKTARRLGIAAILVTLLVNPLIATGVRGVVTASTGGYEARGPGTDKDWDPIWDTYPGSKYTDAKDILSGPSYEDFATRSDALLLDLRDTLTAEFGFEWVERQPAVTEPDHNGFGGDSMLFRYTAPVWQTTTTVTTLEEKNRLVELIRQVGLRHGIANLDFQNAPAAWREPGELTESYGGETLDTQAKWTLHTYDAIGAQDSFSADIIDLSLDTTGSVTTDRQFDVDYYDMAADGIEFHLDSYSLLKSADRQAFIDALKPYASLDKPK